MKKPITKGSYAHVTGTFDLATKTGSIDYVTPVRVATKGPGSEDTGIRLVGEDPKGSKLFDIVVRPQRNSCAPSSKQGTFSEFVAVTAKLHKIRLDIAGATAAEFTRGMRVATGQMSLGPATAGALHRVPLRAGASLQAMPGVTYIVQAKPDAATAWETLAVGLQVPSTTIDVNQFPGATSVKVRVLQSDGFSESVVFEEEKTFRPVP